MASNAMQSTLTLIPLAQHYAGQRLDEAEVVARIYALADAVADVHRLGRLHGNITPATVLHSTDGSTVLAPGLTPRREDADGSLYLQVNPGFSPIEAYLQQGELGPWSDLYGIGALAYWLMTGTALIEAPARTMAQTRVFAAASDSDAPYSTPLRSLVETLLAVDHRERPQSIAELRARMAPLQAIAPVSAATFSNSSEHGVASIDPQRLQQVRDLLTGHLMAPVVSALIAQCGRKARDWQTFCAAVAARLDDAPLREAFTRRFMTNATAVAAETGSATASENVIQGATIFPATLTDALESELRNTLGAVARVVIRRALLRAKDFDSLVHAISAEIEDPARARQFRDWATSELGPAP